MRPGPINFDGGMMQDFCLLGKFLLFFITTSRATPLILSPPHTSPEGEICANYSADIVVGGHEAEINTFTGKSS
jgi:hypothetical protein